MLDLLRNLTTLNNLVFNKVKGQQLVDEAEAFVRSGEYANARAAFEESARRGNADAAARLAWLHLKGRGAEANWQQAAHWLDQAFGAEVKGTAFILGMIHGIGGYGLRRDLASAERYFVHARDKEADTAAGEMLALVKKRQGVFGGKEKAKPPIPWK